MKKWNFEFHNLWSKDARAFGIAFVPIAIAFCKTEIAICIINFGFKWSKE